MDMEAFIKLKYSKINDPLEKRRKRIFGHRQAVLKEPKLQLKFDTYIPTLYNTILRIAKNFLETRENIKILTHPFYHINLG